jgi:hypothetical protein
MSENFYEVLRARATDTSQLDTDGIAACLTQLAKNLDLLHPANKTPFVMLVEQMNGHLKRLRQNRFSAYDYFAGKGSVARKLREHLKMDDWVNPGHRARNTDLVRQIDVCFNKFPTRDEGELKELADFVKLTMPLMNGHAQLGDFKDIPHTVPKNTLESGFYAINMPSGLKRGIMVLRTKLVPNEVEACYILEIGEEECLMLYHPEEGEWFQADYTFTFSTLVSHLRRELDALITPLGLSAQLVDLNEELTQIFAKANYVFDNHARIPNSGVEHVLHQPDETRIVIPMSKLYQWRFIDTRGAYPNRSMKFVMVMGSHLQSALPESLNEVSRQSMVKNLHTALDEIIGALVPENTEASQEA